MFGDEGSGAWIGRRALSVVTASADGREPETALVGAVLTAAQVNEPQELIAWAAQATPALLASLAPVVSSVADAGDLRANAILSARRGGAGAARAHAGTSTVRRRARGDSGGVHGRDAHEGNDAAEAARASAQERGAGRAASRWRGTLFKRGGVRSGLREAGEEGLLGLVGGSTLPRRGRERSAGGAKALRYVGEAALWGCAKGAGTE